MPWYQMAEVIASFKNKKVPFAPNETLDDLTDSGMTTVIMKATFFCMAWRAWALHVFLSIRSDSKLFDFDCTPKQTSLKFKLNSQ